MQFHVTKCLHTSIQYRLIRYRKSYLSFEPSISNLHKAGMWYCRVCKIGKSVGPEWSLVFLPWTAFCKSTSSFSFKYKIEVFSSLSNNNGTFSVNVINLPQILQLFGYAFVKTFKKTTLFDCKHTYHNLMTRALHFRVHSFIFIWKQ